MRSLSKRSLYWLICSALVFPTACENTCSTSWSAIDPTGTWNIRGIGRLTSCTRSDYDTNSFRLNSQSLSVTRSGGALISSDSTWVSGSFNEMRDEVTFSVQEESSIGALTFEFSGDVQWRDSEMTISGSFNVSGSCSGSGVFVTLVDSANEPIRISTCDDSPQEPEIPTDDQTDQDATFEPISADAMMRSPQEGVCLSEVESGDLNRSTLQTRLPDLATASRSIVF